MTEAQVNYVSDGGVTSGLTISLHPLPIMNVSEHFNRLQLTSQSPEKLLGALLGTQHGREVSIVNSFDLIYAQQDSDVHMEEGGVPTQASASGLRVNNDFLERRKEQFKEVFPTLDVVGWYSIGQHPSADDVALHAQFAENIDTPILLLFNPTPPPGSQALPIKVYEAALEGGKGEDGDAQFVAVDYAIETGEAERIAVDGVSRGGMGSEGEEGTIVANLTTQRNAIRMLHDRVAILLQYIAAVSNKTAPVDHAVLRQITTLVATLPIIDADGFREELSTEYNDVQLTAHLQRLTKQLSALSDYADMHNLLHPPSSDDFGGSIRGTKASRGYGTYGSASGGTTARRQRGL
ncbi:hypothetical protein IAU60_006243 [Kwoniella sp. DSM 27419]